MKMIDLAERQILPDTLIRFGMKNLINQRLRDEYANNVDMASKKFTEQLNVLKSSPIAIETDAANEQHYEVPAEFYVLSLGKNLKYSSCYWDENTTDLDQAEENMLKLYLERGDFKDGQDILELGCGWGSLTLYMAKHLPNSNITGVSNSNSQREYIEAQAKQRGLNNVRIITCDVNELHMDERFDRVVSIEMFEHMRNYQDLFSRISMWLKEEGKLFVHIFCHRYLMYPFETEGDDNWMGKYFFTGGLMPAMDTLLHFQNELSIENKWSLSGQHYEKTARAWLENTDKNKDNIIKCFTDAYGKDEAKLWLQRWRMFYMACEELFGYREGREWLVGHYLFKK